MKPFYYAVVDGRFYFASEAKALLPFLPGVETDLEGLRDYLTFQFCLDGKTLFSGIRELLPGHRLQIRNGNVEISRYWDVSTTGSTSHATPPRSRKSSASLFADSVRVHLRADVPVGAYLSGGLDSSIVASLAADERPGALIGVQRKFALGPAYDESAYAREAQHKGTSSTSSISRWMTSSTTSVGSSTTSTIRWRGLGPSPNSWSRSSRGATARSSWGGRGGGRDASGAGGALPGCLPRARLRAAIELRTMHNGNFVVTYESILPDDRAQAVQADAPGLLARRHVRADGPSWHPSHHARQPPRRRSSAGTSWATTRPAETFRLRSSRPS